MMDSSDGLARSLHQLADASDCGFAIDWGRVPLDETVSELATTDEEEREFGLYTGEDFELVFTISHDRIDAARDASPVPISTVGNVTDRDVVIDDEPLPDRGYTHGR
jgi:thiamine-monophosphate kinase